ncbi:MAG TPA: WD40 repeat domain-containing protein, partial [Actinomycetes bacterium]|nr:WD40 repeat domain-containing protein [Actinomycetes bacterium]
MMLSPAGGPLAGDTGAVTSVAFSPDGGRVASGGANGTVLLWDLATGAQARRLAGHTDAVRAVAFSPDGALLATASGDRTLAVWDPATGEGLQRFTGHGDAVRAVAVAPDGLHIASGGGDGVVLVWSPTTGQVTHRRPPRRFDDIWGIRSLAFGPGGALLIAGDGDRAVLWEPASGREIGLPTGRGYPVLSVAFGYDGRFLATTSRPARSGSGTRPPATSCASPPTIPSWRRAGSPPARPAIGWPPAA